MYISACYDHTVTVSHKSPAFFRCVINLSICSVLAAQVPVAWYFFTARCSGVQAEGPQRLDSGTLELSGNCSLPKYVKMTDEVSTKCMLLYVGRIQDQV